MLWRADLADRGGRTSYRFRWFPSLPPTGPTTRILPAPIDRAIVGMQVPTWAVMELAGVAAAYTPAWWVRPILALGANALGGQESSAWILRPDSGKAVLGRST